jgi:methylisocitrate lyase
VPGKKFREALKAEKPLQIPGVINAYVAMMAESVGYRALYVSGAGIANSSYGLPDLGMTTLDNVLEDVRRISGATELPLLVDIDTGWGGTLVIERAVREMEKAGAAAVHIEDQEGNKRCGHRDGKRLIDIKEMTGRIKAALDGREDASFVIMARTDALAVEGVDAMIERARAYEEAGADMLFIEAVNDLDIYKKVKKVIKVPILANMTEFGKTPMATIEEFAAVGVDMVLYPLSANRAMNLAALEVLHEIRKNGTQRALLDRMQTREELYHYLSYEEWEKRIKK